MCLNVGGEGRTGSESLAVTAAQENTQARGPHTSHRLVVFSSVSSQEMLLVFMSLELN